KHRSLLEYSSSLPYQTLCVWFILFFNLLAVTEWALDECVDELQMPTQRMHRNNQCQNPNSVSGNCRRLTPRFTCLRCQLPSQAPSAARWRRRNVGLLRCTN